MGYIHTITSALDEGKKVHRLGWPKGDYAVSGKSLTEFELDKDESKSLGLKEGAKAVVAEGALVYVREGVAHIGYAPSTDDKNSADWHEFNGK